MAHIWLMHQCVRPILSCLFLLIKHTLSQPPLHLGKAMWHSYALRKLCLSDKRSIGDKGGKSGSL